jgi:hypothetical protein
VRGGRKGTGPKINWDLLSAVASSDRAYQRQIIRKDRRARPVLRAVPAKARDSPSIPGAVIISRTNG